MFKRYTRTSVSILFVALVAGCVVPQPTVTPVSSTVTTVPPALTAVSLTLTPVPPASLPSEAATSIPVETAPLDGRGGGFIAFYSERDGNAEIYIINADGSAETRLTQDRARDIVPDLSPDGSQIVFVSNRNGNDEIYRMDRDGSDVVRLTDTRAEDTYPYWSSDGTKIIFCSRRDDDRTYEVYLMNSDGTDQTRITNNAVSEEWAYLSLDMQEVVYAVGPFPHYSLYVMNIDGSDSRQIFSSDRSAALPKWSRDGRTIVFNHFTLSSGKIIGDIGWVNRDGNNFRQITRSSDDSVSENPYWSPDGSRIVFQLNQTGNFQIYVMDADGSNQVRLTNHRGNDYWPSWGGTHSPVLPFQMEKGEQGFSSRETFQAGLGDLDGDGDLDAVFANPQKNNAQVWLNDGKGMFVDTGQQLTQYGHGVGVADFDGDGDLDAFIACHQFVTASRIYLNDGAGLFQDSGQDLGDASISGAELNLVDLNGDGNVDVHVMYYDPNGLPDRVYLNDGAGVFSDSGLALDEETIAWGDLDSDGDVDYFGKRWGQGYVAQFNDGGQFSTGWEMEDSQSTVGGVALADFDGDGDLDALVTNGFRRTGSFLSLLFWNDGGGQFTDSGQRLNETMGSELAVGDLDGDGDLDVFVSNMDLPNEVWLNERGQFIDSGLRLGENSDMSGKPSLGDLDGDGDLDVFVGRFNGGAEVWFNSGQEDEK
jgi:Tol biopolymer transport system component